LRPWGQYPCTGGSLKATESGKKGPFAAQPQHARDYCLTVLSKTSQVRFFYDILAAWVMLPRICGEMQAGICSINKGWNEETGVKEDTPT